LGQRKGRKSKVRPTVNRTRFAGSPAFAIISIRDLAIWASIFIATLVAYFPALRGGLIWDDTDHVTRPGLQSLHGLWDIWFRLGATAQYYPLLHSAFWLEHRLWGDSVLGYHLLNLSLHTAGALLVVLIVRRLNLPGAWLAGLIFALHPVCVESVAWISEQKSTLSGVFYLASALTYLHFDETRRRSLYFWALGLFVLALLSKTVTATLPAALLVIFWWKRGSLEWRRDVRPLLPWFALGATCGIFTAWVERTVIGAEGATYNLSAIQHFLLAGRIICFYAGKLVWPSDLMFSYPRWQVDPTVWWQYLYPLGVAVAVTICLWWLPRRRGPLAGLLIFVGTLFPVLGFLHVFPFQFSYVADHFQYLASLGIIVPVAYALTYVTARTFPEKSAHTAVLVVLLAVLSILTWRQTRIYRDAETLYRATLARNPASWLTHYNLGGTLAQVPGREPEAIEEFRTALRIRPDYALAHNSLGYLLAKQPDRLSDAIAEYQAALRSDPGYALAHNNLGIALAQIPGRVPEAIAEFQSALRIRPRYANAHMNLANALAQMPGRQADAVAEYQAALRIEPNKAQAHTNEGILLSQMPGRVPDAIAEFQAALQSEPNDARNHELLGDALSQIPGRLPEAIDEYRVALRIQPDDLDAHLSLADALAKVPGQRQQAIAEYEAVLRARPDLVAARTSIERLRAGQP